MPIDVTCGGCGRLYTVADAFANKRARCLVCGTVTIVPDPKAPSAADFDLVGAMGMPPQSLAGPLVRDHTAPHEIQPEELHPDEFLAEPDEPPRVFVPEPGEFEPVAARPIAIAPVAAPTAPVPIAPLPTEPDPPAGGFRLGFRINAPVGVCLVIAGLIGFAGVKEWRFAATAATAPQTISCLQLEQSGPGKNTYIHLTGFSGLPQGYVYEYEKRAGSDDEIWTMVWVPVVSVDGGFKRAARMAVNLGMKPSDIKPPSRISVVLKSKTIHSAAEQNALMTSRSIDGLVINQMEPLSEKQKQQLAGQFPETDFSGAWVVEVGRRPAPPAKYLGLVGAGAVFLLLGLFLMLKPAS